jgi:hypothetical protein
MCVDGTYAAPDWAMVRRLVAYLMIPAVTLVIGGGCLTSEQEPSETEEAELKKLDTPEYAAHCDAQVGPIPAMDCSTAPEIPIYRTLADGTKKELTYAYFQTAAGKAELASGKPVTCDAPTMVLSGSDPLLGGCVPHSRSVTSEGTNAQGQKYTWVAICRNFQLRPKTEYVYDELGIIGHNQATGKTCFLSGRETNFALGGKTYTNKILGKARPAYTDKPAFLRQTEILPGRGGLPAGPGVCNRCHSQGPFVMNPYISQMKSRQIYGTRANAPYALIDGERLATTTEEDPRRAMARRIAWMRAKLRSVRSAIRLEVTTNVAATCR